MKQLTCEMCGSTDLVKQDGVFVCQSCCCKYSVEEARKMMIEGTVEVTGTVKVDNTANAEKYRKMADDAYAAGNYEEASNTYNKLLEILPGDHKALFRKGLCLLNVSKLNDIKADEMIRYANLAVKAFEETNPTVENIAQHRSEMAKELLMATNMVHTAAISFIRDNWKLQSNHSVYWNAEICSIAIAEYGKCLLEKDEYLLYEDNLSLYQHFCNDIANNCSSLCQRREYVDSIVDGGILGPMECKGKVWLNDSIANNYRRSATKAREDSTKAQNRISKLKAEAKERARLAALKANPKELAERIASFDKRLNQLTENETVLTNAIQALLTKLKEQQAIYDKYRIKLFGEGAKLKKEALGKISNIKNELSLKQNELDKIKNNLQATKNELATLRELL